MKTLFFVLLAAVLGGCAAPSVPRQPEAATGWTAKPGWATRHSAVAAANPLATQAGWTMLQEGGSAIDAAVAVQMVLALVEPQSSGLGGGAFLLHFDGKTTQAYDGRETAPAAADSRLFLDADGKPLAFRAAIAGGRAVGTPGAVRMLEMAQRAHGRLPWARLFAPAIALAEAGFPVSPRLHGLLRAEQQLAQDPVAAAYFYDAQGKPWPVGHVLKNPELAAVLRRIATEGSQALHEGEVAQAIVAKVRGHSSNPGHLSLADLASYRALQREPLCFDWQPAAQALRICGMPPPGSATIAIGQILGVLARTPASSLPLQDGLPGAPWLHLYAEASRLAYADRAQYVADPAFVQPPAGGWAGLLSPDYLAQRASLVGPQRAPQMPAGRPGGTALAYAPMPEQPEQGTSHISVVDARGHALAMTSTIEDAFGARQMVNRGKGLAGGFLLNNELSDFSFVPEAADGKPVANRVEPGKRPRSSMAPTLVFERGSGRLLMSLGSPGGAMIIHYAAKALVGNLQWGLDMQRAIDLPNFGQMEGPLLLEAKRFPPATLQGLRANGHSVQEVPLTSGLQGIAAVPGGLFSGADPRREGIVLGD